MLYQGLAQKAAKKAREIANVDGNARKGFTGPAAELGRMLHMAEAFEGNLLVDVMATHLDQLSGYTARRRVRVPLHRDALLLAIAGTDDVPESELRHIPTGRSTSIDLLLHWPDGHVTTYEIKRGADAIGRDHLRQRLDNMRALRLVGRDMARSLLNTPVESFSQYVISYYGASNFPAEMTIPGPELDAHFGVDLIAVIEAHLQFFRYRLDLAVPGLTGDARAPSLRSGSWANAA